MASRSLQIVVDLKDRASKQLNGMQGKIQDMQPAFRKMAAVGTAGFAGISAGVAKATERAGMAEGAFNKFNTVFGENEEMMNEWVNNVRKDMPMATDEIARMTAGVGDLLKPMGIAEDEAAELSKESVELANQIAAFNDVSPERVLEAMQSGFTGMSRPLKQFGIDAREGALEAIALEEGLIEAGQSFSDLENNTQNAVRAEALMIQMTRQSEDAIGGFEENQDSLIRRKQELAATTKDLATVFGEAFLPMIDNIIIKVTPVIEKISRWVEENPRLTQTIVVATAAITGIIGALGILGITVAAITPALGVLGTVVGALSAPVLIVIGVVGLLVAALTWLWYNSNDVVNWMTEKWQGFKDFFSNLWKSLSETVSSWLTTIMDNIKEKWNGIKDFFGNIWDGIKNIFSSSINGLIGMVESFINGVIIGINNYITKLNQAAAQMARIPGVSRPPRIDIMTTGVDLPRLAEGGIVTDPTTALIGESGPEAVIPLDKMQMAGGGGITINVYGDVSGEELVRKVKDKIARELNREIRL